MPFAEVFGGQNIFPAQLTFLPLVMTADVELQWPTEVSLPGQLVFADIIHVTSDQANRVITFPDATIAGNGQSTLVNNVGAFTIIVHDNAGNVIGSVPSGQVWEFYLNDNSTPAGAWSTFQFGTGASSASAAALAGAGLKAITTTLNFAFRTDTQAVGTLAIVDADRARVKQWTGGAGAATLPDPATLGDDWNVMIRNNGTGSLTITPAAGNINGSPTLVLAPLSSAIIYTDGTDYYTIGLSTVTTDTFDYTTISVAGTGDFTLTGPSQQNRIAYKFTGLLTGARNIIVPDSIQEYWVNNATTGQFALTVKTSAGTGIVVPPGCQRILYCDGANVVSAQAGNLFCTGRNNGQNLTTASALTNLIFDDTDIIDVGDWHDIVTNNERFVVPPGVTAVEVSFNGVHRVVTAGQNYWIILVQIQKNAVAVQFAEVMWVPPAIPGSTSIGIPTAYVPCVAGDIFRCQYLVLSDPGNLTTSIMDELYFSIKAIR
jgi:hypothetical protein